MQDVPAAGVAALGERAGCLHEVGRQQVASGLAYEVAGPAVGEWGIGPVSDAAHRTLAHQALMLARDVLRESILANAVVLADYLRCGSRWYLQQARFMVRYPLEQRVHRLSMPILVIRGGNDPIATTDWCRRLVQQRSDARLVAVPRHRHVVQFAAPRAVASAIRPFLARTRRPRSTPQAYGRTLAEKRGLRSSLIAGARARGADWCSSHAARGSLMQ